MTGERANGQVIEAEQDERKLRLLDAAVGCIAERGYDAVRLRDVAMACGVTTGMIQHYFASREALLVAAFEQVALEQVDAWRHVIQSEPDESRRLGVLLERMLDEFGDADTCAVWSELCVSAGRHEHLKAVVHHVFEQWHGLLGEAVSAGVQIGVLEPVMAVEDANALIVAAIDGFELAIATRSGAAEPTVSRQRLLMLADSLFPQA